MSKKNENVLNILAQLPWWVSVITSSLAYVCVAVVLPSMEWAQNPVFKGVKAALPNIALVLALVLLSPAPVSVFNTWRKRKQLDAQESIATIRDLSWQQFEQLVAEAYRRQGYTVLENLHGGPDGGVDIRLRKGSELHLIQCKHWKRRDVGVSTVRELYGVMAAEHASSGSVVCTGMFSQDAKNFAHGKNVDLVDGHQLAEMVKQVQPMQPSQPSVTQADSPVAIPSCPKCGNDLVLRPGRSGTKFWGCSTFPKSNCRYTRNI